MVIFDPKSPMVPIREPFIRILSENYGKLRFTKTNAFNIYDDFSSRIFIQGRVRVKV